MVSPLFVRVLIFNLSNWRKYDIREKFGPFPDLGKVGMGSAPQGNISCRHSEQRSRAQRDSESPAKPVNASYRLDFRFKQKFY